MTKMLPDNKLRSTSAWNMGAGKALLYAVVLFVLVVGLVGGVMALLQNDGVTSPGDQAPSDRDIQRIIDSWE